MIKADIYIYIYDKSWYIYIYYIYKLYIIYISWYMNNIYIYIYICIYIRVASSAVLAAHDAMIQVLSLLAVLALLVQKCKYWHLRSCRYCSGLSRYLSLFCITLYIYIYTMCVCVCIYIFICIYIYIYTYILTHTHIHTHTHTHVYTGAASVGSGGGGGEVGPVAGYRGSRHARYQLYLLYWYKSTNTDTWGPDAMIQVLSLLALLVQEYKYWRLRRWQAARTGRQKSYESRTRQP